MTIKEFYNAISESYDDVFKRFCSEDMIKRFVKKFAEDKSFELLERSLSSGNAEEAFRAVHTLKGIAFNLGFSKLGNLSSSVTEMLRRGDEKSAKEAFPVLSKCYKSVVEFVSEIE